MRIPAVGAVITDDDGRVLLVLRGHAPATRRWSLPGGRIEPGETTQQALAREVQEETGLEVAVGDRLGSLTIPIDGTAAYDVIDYRCTIIGGQLRAADDADDARWVTPEQLRLLPTSTDLVGHLTSWQILPP
jgi:ADP-ribose pyrophosphatase YjhB (NUDIX family)